MNERELGWTGQRDGKALAFRVYAASDGAYIMFFCFPLIPLSSISLFVFNTQSKSDSDPVSRDVRLLNLQSTALALVPGWMASC
jgi:hypothetical protein